jgi:hypothetical protein
VYQKEGGDVRGVELGQGSMKTLRLMRVVESHPSAKSALGWGTRDEAAAAGDGVERAPEDSGDQEHDGGVDWQVSRCIRKRAGMSGGLNLGRIR